MDIYFCPLFVFQMKNFVKKNEFFVLEHNAVNTKKMMIINNPTLQKLFSCKNNLGDFLLPLYHQNGSKKSPKNLL